MPLWVYLEDRRVARLDDENRRMTLRYDPDAHRPLSVRLPVRADAYADADCRPFFANLLPEGSWRAALSRQLGIAPDDDFGLLGAIGEDCAGAVALSEEAAWTPEAGRYRETSEAELTEWVRHPVRRPSLDLTPGLRLSLAGAQDKLLIHLEDGRPFLCEGGAPSTVIVKPDIRDAFNQIELTGLNELLSMRLAARAGLAVPHAFWFAGAFAVERFDRWRVDRRWRRLHQEDFAQVLGLPVAAKYDVSWKAAFTILSRYATTPAKARTQLCDRLLFDLVLGNNDAHGKNFALLHQSDTTVGLAPAYDLLCTELYPSLSQTLAMPIAQAKTRAELEPEVWRTFCRDVGIGLPFMRRRSSALVATVRNALDDHLQATENEAPALRRDIYPSRRRSELFDGFQAIVRANCDVLMRSFG